MLASSIALTNIEVHKYLEAAFQNFAAGLILAAVASELFPLMITGVTDDQTWIGVTVGFVVGLGVLNGMEVVIDYFSSEDDDEEHAAQKTESEKFKMIEMREMIVSKMSTKDGVKEVPAANQPNMNEDFVRVSVIDTEGKDEKEQLAIEEEFRELYEGDALTPREWEDEEVHKASLAIAQPQHRSHLHEHVREVVECIALMEQQCSRLLDDSVPKTRAETEQLAEEIDERTHSLQYKLDHCRRCVLNPNPLKFNRFSN